jgi:DNA-binding FadR family transcriptional regulator
MSTLEARRRDPEMRPIRVTSAVSAAADALREEIFTRPDGDWLGSEDDLLQQLDISRPTLRQAARLLEAEELLVVKRGLNGGLFTRRPTSYVVARMASLYLRSEGTTVIDLGRSWFLLLEQSARLAAGNPDSGARARLLDDVVTLCTSLPNDDREAAFMATQAFARKLTELASSPTLALFADVLSALISDAPADLRRVSGPDDPGGRDGQRLQRVAEAVKAGDGAKAARYVRKLADVIEGWLQEAMPGRTLEDYTGKA